MPLSALKLYPGEVAVQNQRTNGKIANLPEWLMCMNLVSSIVSSSMMKRSCYGGKSLGSISE
jgi:hypothetical protein